MWIWIPHEFGAPVYIALADVDPPDQIHPSRGFETVY